MRHFWIRCAIAASALFPAIPAKPQGPDEIQVRIDSLVAEARRNNPAITAARQQWIAARAAARGVAAWDPPKAGVEFYQTPVASFPNPVRNGMETDYYLEQMIPFPGKTGAMGKAAGFGARMAEEEIRTKERRVIFELKAAFAELYFIQRKIDLNSESRRFVLQLADVASRQYEVGIASQTDVLRARTELAGLEADGISLEREKRSTEAMMNTILNRPLDGTFERIDTLETPPARLSRGTIDSLTVDSRPELLAMRFETEMGKADVHTAKWEYMPDFMTRVMVKDMAMTPKDYWSFMVGVTMPFAPWAYPKVKARVDEMKARARTSEASYAQMKNMTLLDVQNAWLALQTNGKLVDLNRTTVLPQAELALESAMAGYRTGKVMFIMLIDAYRMALMARQDYYMAVMNQAVSLAQIEQAVGLDVSEIAGGNN
jgi:cobalt-zinc-cadmium efflux system outer membrane protein